MTGQRRSICRFRHGGECSESQIAALVDAARASGADVIIGAGGGKALDTAKAAARDLGLPVIVFPTIAASDAPCSALAVIYNDDGSVAYDTFLHRNPDLVLVDALAECDAKTAGPAMERVVEANIFLSGIGFESGGVAAAHAIHHGLCELDDVHHHLHGEKVTIGVLAGLKLHGLDAEFETVRAFCARVRLPVRLADIGIADATDGKLAIVARRACRPGEIIHNEPMPDHAGHGGRGTENTDLSGRSTMTMDSENRAFSEMLLAGKTVVVSGGSSGIGLAIAQGFAGAGAKVIASGSSSAKIAECQANEAHGGIDFRPLDVRDNDAVKTFFSGLSSLDVPVNCQGVARPDAEWDEETFLTRLSLACQRKSG